jgi:hypothetical protein
VIFLHKKLAMGIVSIALLLVGCSTNSEDTKTQTETTKQTENATSDHSQMNHTSTAEIPEGLKTAENPIYPVGSKAIIKEGHMEGMKDAEATIVGAYDTTVYSVSYTPTGGGERVWNHEWVIHEEINDADAGQESYDVGTEVTLNTDHVKGMKDSTAIIESAQRMNVYVVDYAPTNGGEKITNHMWVVESELQSIKDLVKEYSASKIENLSASITSEQLIITNNNEKKITYELPKDEFFVSIAPYIEKTHPCEIHSLTGCQGELVGQEFDVLITDQEDNVVIDEKIKSRTNGFIDLWLPRNKTYNVSIQYNGKKAEAEIATFEKNNTCVTSMQLK